MGLAVVLFIHWGVWVVSGGALAVSLGGYTPARFG